MIEQILYTALMMCLMVVIHTYWSIHILGIIPTIKPLRKSIFFILIRISVSMLSVHFIEAIIFALFYYFRSGFDSIEIALYYSITSYATVGFGDTLLPCNLQIIGAAEGLIGILLCGWTVALLSGFLKYLKLDISE